MAIQLDITEGKCVVHAEVEAEAPEERIAVEIEGSIEVWTLEAQQRLTRQMA